MASLFAERLAISRPEALSHPLTIAQPFFLTGSTLTLRRWSIVAALLATAGDRLALGFQFF
jgi:hypothetical protein